MNENSCQITITANEDKKETITAKVGLSLYHMLANENIILNNACGGNGICGKCRVQFIKNATPAAALDHFFFTKEEIIAGWRLACCAYPKENGEIVLPSELEKEPEENKQKIAEEKTSEYAVAIDIGTTTIVYALVDLKSHTEINLYTEYNCLRIYGADVISRVKASAYGKREEMKNRLNRQILEGLKKVSSVIADFNYVTKIAAAGNTVMIHLLMGYSTEGFFAYPFHPQNMNFIVTDTFELGWSRNKTEVVIMPAISAFVGGDVLAGMTFLYCEEQKKNTLLIDFGTNAELALCDGEGNIFITSTAAGPAFEGGGISCGMPALPGAVCHVEINGKEIQYQTIQNKKAVGICGSGVLETVYELLKEKLIDETGLLTDEFFDQGFLIAAGENKNDIIMTQEDIRKLQMAKSAVMTGTQILLSKAGMQEKDVKKVYLSGNFMKFLAIKKAAAIGLLPYEWEDKAVVSRNTSLYGVLAFLYGEITMEDILAVKKQSTEVILANEEEFHERYLQNMYL